MTRTLPARTSYQARACALAVLFSLGLIVTGAPHSLAQQNPDDRPYDDKLLRLSEILGAGNPGIPC